ncbi:MAG: transposase [Candidatus Marinimicrobia bacterium]|nr:transposase [Candidatus Neomarinimicrobiota bacterium]
MSQRKHYSASRKVEIVREHLENQVPVSELSRRYGIHPNMIHKWKKELFENAVDSFGRSKRQTARREGVKSEQLQRKLKDRDSLIAEIMEDNIRLKKKLNGDI